MDKLSAAVVNGNYQNPVLPMDFSDPDAVRVGEDYYLISSSFTYLPGVPVLHSRDLVHWERIGNCVERLPFDRYAEPAHGCGTWAPSLRWHDGRFYAFIPLPDEGIFYTTATDPRGPWSELHCVKEASGWIDPCPLWDDDGSVYMAHAFANSRCGIKHKIQLSKLNPETLEVIDDGPIVFDGTLTQPTAEGPKMYKRDGWYYIFIPAGGVEYGWQTVLRSRNVLGPYEDRIVMHQGNAKTNGPHQGAWVDDPQGNDWFLHFQDRFELGRVVHLQ
uniref:glycoside hydrolase 43 family protein n=1 Tax=Gemmiger formicilis TaxID=745368 RepID=UPI0040290B67